MENKQKPVERETRQLIQTYNVLLKSQIYAYFAKTQRDHFVGRAFKTLEKEKQIYIHQDLEMAAINEEAFKARNVGTLQAFWVLLDIMDQKEVDQHFLASKEEYPVRIVLCGEGEIYDILYVSENEVQVTNNLFTRKMTDDCGHIVIVEKPGYIHEIRIPDVLGFCTVKEGGEIDITEMRMDENDSFFKLKEQLEDAQKLMGRMEQYIVEARGVLQSCIRRQSEFQYAYLGDMIQETAKTSERLTDKLRRLTLEIVVNPKEYEKYKEDLVLIHGIELEYKDEILRVSAPVLIPHRKDCYTDYLYKPLHTAFRNWCMQRAEEKLEIPTYTNCTICFVHVYDETLPLARVRDHDNYEEKHVQDIITNFFLRSDSGLYTNTCHVTRMGEEDRTLLYVMDSSKFPAWISDFGKETGIEKNHE